MHAFEIESVEPVTRATGADWLLDVKVTPNRAHDCLSHRGIARELGTLLDIKVKEDATLSVHPLPRVSIGKPERQLAVEVADQKLCRRYVGRVMEQIEVRQSPDWLADALAAIAQKSINNVVDVANFVMFHLGQPLHAFDADMLRGGDDAPTITVRHAEKGEMMTTLDKKELTLTEDDLILSDGTQVLGLAGVKGGASSGITMATKHIVLEAANFAPTPIRRGAQRHGLRTDASCRFENDLAAELAEEAMELFTRLLLVTAKTDKTKVGPLVDWYPRPRKPYMVGFRVADVKNVLGVEIPEKDIVAILHRLQLPWKKVSPLEEVLKLAPKQVGKPFNKKAQISFDAPESFDCSSLTGYLFAQGGVAIPRMSIDQYFFGSAVDLREMQAGDLIFSNTHDGGDVKFYSEEWMPGHKVKEGLDHVGLYVGGGKLMHTSRHNSQGSVIIEKLKDAPLFQDVIGIRRMVTDTDERFVVTVPPLRLDLRRKEDIIEEIGRLYGYEQLPAVQPTEVIVAPELNSSVVQLEKLRDALVGAEFSEVYLYAFVPEGEVALANPLASDHAYLRCGLIKGVGEAVVENLKYQDEVRIFETGHAFMHDTPTNQSQGVTGETNRLAIGMGTKRKLKPGELFYEMKGVVDLLGEVLRVPLTIGDDYFITSGETRVGWAGPDGLAEFQLDALETLSPARVQYSPIARFPAIARDIALFVASETKVGDVLETLLAAAGPLVAQSRLFDTFEKEGRKSLAFRLVFQSKERTLQDAEVNEVMKLVSAAVVERGWQVR